MMATIPILLGNVKVDLDGERYTPPPIYGDLDLYKESDDTLAFIPPKKLLQYVISAWDAYFLLYER